VALHLEWLGIAEGSVIDSRGVASLVGVNQNVITPQSFPFAWSSSVYVFATEDSDDISENQEVSGTVTLDFLDPDGTIISSSTQTIKNQRKYKEIPVTIALAAQVVIAIQKPGRFTIACALRSANDGEPLEQLKKYVYILPLGEE
jgi:hypothetical protein